MKRGFTILLTVSFMLAGMLAACTSDSPTHPGADNTPSGVEPSPSDAVTPPEPSDTPPHIPLYFPSPYAITTNLSDEELEALGFTSLQEFADPSLVYHEGVYYIYATNQRGVVVARSTDNLESFEHMGYALRSPDVEPPHFMFWAPDVIYNEDDQTFYMYYSSSVRGYVDGDSFGQRLKVATSKDPLGPFEFHSLLELDWDDRLLDVWSPLHQWAIDAHMVKRDGKYTLFFAYKGWSEHVEASFPVIRSPESFFATMIFMQEFSDPLTPVPGTMRPAVSATMREELNDTSGAFDVGIWEYCLEGPYYFEHDGTGYLMYSGNSWESPYYFIGYATWDLNGDLSDAVFQKYPDHDTFLPLIGIDDNATGMGHHSICVTPEGRILMAHHGRPVSTEGLPSPDNRNSRRLYITELTVEDGRLAAHRPYDIPVSYHLNGGAGEGPDPFSMAAGSVFTAADITGVEAPEGMTFKEWNTRSNGTGRVYAPGEAVTVPASKLILYAIWE